MSRQCPGQVTAIAWCCEDQVQCPVQQVHGPVTISRLLAALAADCEILLPQHPWYIMSPPLPPAPVTALSLAQTSELLHGLTNISLEFSRDQERRRRVTRARWVTTRVRQF